MGLVCSLLLQSSLSERFCCFLSGIKNLKSHIHQFLYGSFGVLLSLLKFLSNIWRWLGNEISSQNHRFPLGKLDQIYWIMVLCNQFRKMAGFSWACSVISQSLSKLETFFKTISIPWRRQRTVILIRLIISVRLCNWHHHITYRDCIIHCNCVVIFHWHFNK